MIKLLTICSLLFLSAAGVSQVVAVSATITDSDGQTWNNGTFQVTFVPNPNYPNANQYNINGVGLTTATYSSYLNQSGTLNGSGTFNVNLLDNTKIAPIGSSWKLQIKPNASSPSQQYPNFQVQGSNTNLSGLLSAETQAPRFPAAGPLSYGYLDGEISVVPNPGGLYFNVTQGVQRIWTGTQWISSPQAVANIYCLLTGCTFTGAVYGTSFTASGAVTGQTLISNSSVNALTYLVNGTPFSASNLSNGVSGTGQVCLSSGSACQPNAGTVNSIGISSNVPTQLRVSGSPITTNGVIALSITPTGTETQFVTAPNPGTSGQWAIWNTNGGLGSQTIPSGATKVVQTMVMSSANTTFCTTANTAYAQCSFNSPSWTTAFASNQYALLCQIVGVPTGALTGWFVENPTTTGFQVVLQNGSASGALATTISEMICQGTL